MASKKKTALVAGKPGKDPVLPRVPLTTNDGVERFLTYDFNAIAVAEEKTGLNLFGAFDFSILSVTKFRAMLFSSLLKDDPELTLEQAGSFVNVHTLAPLTIAMVEAWHGSRPDVKEEKGNDQTGEANE